MFTGIIETTARLVEKRPLAGGALTITVERPAGWDDLQAGESICVDGICLTLVEAADAMRFEVVAETVRMSTAASWQPGRLLNLERSLRPTDRLGGHIVTGHVDGVATVLSVVEAGTGKETTLRAPQELSRYIARKGSVAVNGVSLTVAEVAGETFRVALIPETLERTNLSLLRPGDAVNIEVDVIARYLERLMRRGEGLEELLRRAGFM